jgi:hypothetical protein
MQYDMPVPFVSHVCMFIPVGCFQMQFYISGPQRFAYFYTGIKKIRLARLTDLEKLLSQLRL